MTVPDFVCGLVNSRVRQDCCSGRTATGDLRRREGLDRLNVDDALQWHHAMLCFEMQVRVVAVQRAPSRCVFHRFLHKTAPRFPCVRQTSLPAQSCDADPRQPSPIGRLYLVDSPPYTLKDDLLEKKRRCLND